MAGSTHWLHQETPPLPSPAARRSAEDVALMVDLCRQQRCELDLTWPGPAAAAAATAAATAAAAAARRARNYWVHATN